MKAPTAVKGTAGKAPRAKIAAVQTGVDTYEVQGSGAKPYIVDLHYEDARAGITHHCTCVNWSMVRGREINATGDFKGYACKHIRQIVSSM